MSIPLSQLPVDRAALLTGASRQAVADAAAAAPPDTPAVITVRLNATGRHDENVRDLLDTLENLAVQAFPYWLPGAEAITLPAGAGRAAVRALAAAVAASTPHYRPFLSDLADSALRRDGPGTRHHLPEIRASGLARVLAAAFDRPTCALLCQLPDNLDEHSAAHVARTGEWLADHGGLAVWFIGGPLPGVDRIPEIVFSPPAREHPQRPTTPSTGSGPSARRRRRTTNRPDVVGRPHPSSAAETALEAVLATRPWAAGRAWNKTHRPTPLVNPVRVDLLWERERCVVEIDGADHRNPTKYAEDRQRDVLLQLNGYAVLRFTNTQVLDDVESVLTLLHQFLAARRRNPRGR